ncbi:hypothetical protein A0K93_02325 [Corynebacterium sp. BCW_4722]|nr:hypothetical protein A0K93_02325 [Corynebacterium sp. BCW_4722]
MTNNARTSVLAATVVAGVFAFIGGYSRRWISDDGLIVLRTVRNILAGNGPVFNAGERVEANTSTLWQYLIALFGWLTPARLEDVAMWLALACTVAAAACATYFSGKFWAGHTRVSRAREVGAVIPFGILIYLALPPARDFATSGLEWGLALFWLAVWWALLVNWATPPRRGVEQVGYFLAFWCGLSWLVRPELALYGGVTGLLLIASNWRKTPGILAAALPVPAAYQIFRMGYYGLITPHTAVAKSATDSEWAQGFEYLGDFVGYYWLWLPLVAAAVVAVWFGRGAFGRRQAIMLLTFGCAFVHVVYVLRVGGDFMHARMWLLPLFAALLPVMAVPVTKASGALAVIVAMWGGATIARAHPIDWELYEVGAKELGIVDEREFWTMALKREPGDAPYYAEDFLTSKLMTDWNESLGDALADDAAQITLLRTSREPEAYAWAPVEREPTASDLRALPTTAYLINLGMTSMNAPLDARILDTVGLATPLAARMPRDPEGRVGHDKSLPFIWQVADSDANLDALPGHIDAVKAKQARAALRTPEIAELLASSREPMSWERFFKNARYSLGGGRSLQLDDDPSSYLTPSELEAIARGENPGLDGSRIAWPN